MERFPVDYKVGSFADASWAAMTFGLQSMRKWSVPMSLLFGVRGTIPYRRRHGVYIVPRWEKTHRRAKL